MVIRRKLMVAVTAGLIASASLSGIALADGAEVDIQAPGIIERETPSGLCLRSHHEANPGDPGFEPGQGPGGGNFGDFAAGGGELEFGLSTPLNPSGSNQFNGQSHHPCE